MLSSSWPATILPYVVVVSLASTLLFSSLPAKQTTSAGGAFFRHPLSGVYSDLPYRDPMPVILLSFVAHCLLFRFFPLPATWRSNASRTSELVQRNYCVSTVHAVCAVGSVLLWLVVCDVEWRSVQRGMGGGRRGTGDEWQSLVVCWSLGYFAYDTACMLRHPRTRTGGALLHHTAIGSAFLLGLYTDCCRPFHFLFLLEELSTPPLNLKTLLAANKAAADLCAALFVLSFVVVRLGYGTVVYVLACMQLVPFVTQAAADGERVQAAAAVFQFILCTGSRLLNLYWTLLIARRLTRATRPTAATNQRTDTASSGNRE